MVPDYDLQRGWSAPVPYRLRVLVYGTSDGRPTWEFEDTFVGYQARTVNEALDHLGMFLRCLLGRKNVHVQPIDCGPEHATMLGAE